MFRRAGIAVLIALILMVVIAPAANAHQFTKCAQDGLMWPAWGGIDSYYGMRLHPIYGYYRMHTGLDIDAAWGAPIWAAEAGTVQSSGWDGGYGYSVTIDHGGGLSTLYGHMSSLSVYAGQYVEKCRVIGYAGATGLATGPHLHFEVRVSGSTQDPLWYISYDDLYSFRSIFTKDLGAIWTIDEIRDLGLINVLYAPDFFGCLCA